MPVWVTESFHGDVLSIEYGQNPNTDIIYLPARERYDVLLQAMRNAEAKALQAENAAEQNALNREAAYNASGLASDMKLMHQAQQELEEIQADYDEQVEAREAFQEETADELRQIRLITRQGIRGERSSLVRKRKRRKKKSTVKKKKKKIPTKRRRPSTRKRRSSKRKRTRRSSKKKRKN